MEHTVAARLFRCSESVTASCTGRLLSLHGRPELRGLGLVTDLTNRSEGRDCKQKLNSVALVPSRPLGHLDFAQCVSHNVPTEGDTSSANIPLISGTQMIYTNIRTPKKI